MWRVAHLFGASSFVLIELDQIAQTAYDSVCRKTGVKAAPARGCYCDGRFGTFRGFPLRPYTVARDSRVNASPCSHEGCAKSVLFYFRCFYFRCLIRHSIVTFRFALQRESRIKYYYCPILFYSADDASNVLVRTRDCVIVAFGSATRRRFVLSAANLCFAYNITLCILIIDVKINVLVMQFVNENYTSTPVFLNRCVTAAHN